jgi:hypothetical protein
VRRTVEVGYPGIRAQNLASPNHDGIGAGGPLEYIQHDATLGRQQPTRRGDGDQELLGDRRAWRAKAVGVSDQPSQRPSAGTRAQRPHRGEICVNVAGEAVMLGNECLRE